MGLYRTYGPHRAGRNQYAKRPEAGSDIVIADYRLRGICNGAQVVAHIRPTFGRPIPCILITGDTAPERIREANDHGFTLLHKPVEPADLHAAMSKALSRQPSNGVRAG